MSFPEFPPGLLLVGHGTRSESGTRQFLELAEQLAAMIRPVPVQPAFLELQQPTIAAGIRRLLERDAAQRPEQKLGIPRIVVCPLLLFAAGHAKSDIPAAVRVALEDQGEAWQAHHLGLSQEVLDLSKQRFDEAVATRPTVDVQETCLLLVGRGSRDEQATAEMHELARLRAKQSPGLTVQVAFLAMAQPFLPEMLRQIAAARFRRVIVQPHLLFEGDLADSVRSQTTTVADDHEQQEWIVAPLLADPLADPNRNNQSHAGLAKEAIHGGNKLLCTALVGRYAEAIRVVATPCDD